MKVLHLPIVIANQPWLMVHSLRKIGIESDYMILDDNDCGWIIPGKPDYNLNIYHRAASEDLKKVRIDLEAFFLKAIKKYDVFHYHSNFPLFEDGRDLKILKALKKKIVVSYWGCDIRLKETNLKYQYNTCKYCKIDCQENIKNNRKELFNQYANLKIAHSEELLEYAPRDAIFFPAFIDTDFWSSGNQYSPKNGKHFEIFHIFGNSEIRGDVRGSEPLKLAVANLKKKNLKIDFIFYDQVPNIQLKEIYRQADLVVDQLRYGFYGLTALEVMSMGVPVAGYLRPEYQSVFHQKVPIININPDTVELSLERLYYDRKELLDVAKKSRNFVVKNHDSKMLAKKLLNLYKGLDD